MPRVRVIDRRPTSLRVLGAASPSALDQALVAAAGPQALRALAAAAHGPFTGAVVTLLPSAADAERLAVQGFEAPEALHVTLAWLGDTDGDPAPEQDYDTVVAAIAEALAGSTPIEADAFALAVFNPASDERDPATVLLVQGDALVDLRGLVVETVGDLSDFPVWFPHLTLGYQLGDGSDLEDDAAIAARMGPVVFDRVRVAYGSELTTEIPLEAPMTASARRPRVLAVVPDKYRAGVATAAADDDDPVEAEVGPAPGEPSSLWEGILVVEGVPTGDGRLMEPGSLRWGDLPIPLRWARADVGGHDGAVTVGRILEITRKGGELHARGDLDLRIPEAVELAELMRDVDGQGPTVNGVSVDLDDVDVEIRVAKEVIDAMDAELEAIFAEPGDDETEEAAEPEEPEVDEDGRVVVMEIAADDEMMVTVDARIRAATVVDVPAFVEARLNLVSAESAPELAAEAAAPPPSVAASMVAGSGPGRPPRSWFADPEFGSTPERDPRLVRDEHTGIIAAPLHVSKDGRIFGHIAPWKACHTGYSECVNPPASSADYRYFHVGAVVAADGTEVPTGRITLDTLHAGRRLSAVDTLAHYENTGLAVADVRAGEDAHGIWIAGAIRPGVTEKQLRALRASPLSGDWRRVGGSLELVAALAVNSPGFPVPRAMVASGHVQALQSAGTIRAADRRDDLTEDDRAILRRMAERERATSRRDEVEAARRKVLVASAASRIRGGR